MRRQPLPLPSPTRSLRLLVASPPPLLSRCSQYRPLSWFEGFLPLLPPPPRSSPLLSSVESMAASPPREAVRPPRAEAARRRWWRRALLLILAVAVATTAFAVLLTSALPLEHSIKFASFSSSYAAVRDVPAAMPLPAPLPPPPPPPSSSTVVAPAGSKGSVSPLGPSIRAVSTQSKPTPAGNSSSEGSVEKKKRSGGGSRSSRTERPLWSLPPDEALAYAKSEIQRASVVTDDPDLHAPLFRNVSVFRRSYELMEKILKVYIYRDGSKPIFHTPPLKGIYASEGWFMKLMEENKQFVVRDPNKAHLFYMPYSSRRLQEALYVPDSHDMRPLSIFLKDYVNMLATKYPFWNRTHGSDHFLVACHDWGPYITTAHEELGRNTIKALCNADASEGIFIRGKDVSLPETTIRVPKRPLKYLGGKRISQRSILAFFAGQMHGRVRPILLKYWGGKDDDMKIYGPLPLRVSRVMSYIHHMKTSKFCICPMGFEVNSPRIVEAIYYECVPVIIADNFVPPFDEVLDWSSFSVIVAEKDIPDLKNILQSIPLRRYISMQTNVKRLQKHFYWHPKPIKYDLFHMILHSIWFNRLNQIDIKH